MYDKRIISLVKKNHFTTVGQIEDTLQKSTVKSKFYNAGGLLQDLSLNNKKTRSQAKKKPLYSCGTTDETKNNLNHNEGKRKSLEK